MAPTEDDKSNRHNAGTPDQAVPGRSGLAGTRSSRAGAHGNEAASIAELSIALFALALLAFSPPLLVIFSAPLLVLGIPLLYVYLFIAWGLVILLVALVAKRAQRVLIVDKQPVQPGGTESRPAAKPPAGG